MNRVFAALLALAALNVGAAPVVFQGPGGVLVYDTGAPPTGTPITSMRPNRYYINHSKIPKGLEGIDYDDFTAATSSAAVRGGDTPVLTSGVLRPANCNQEWIGAAGVNKATFQASMSGTTTMTVHSLTTGTIVPGNPAQVVKNLNGAKILAQLSGTPGGAGTYQLSSTGNFTNLPLTSVTNACMRNTGNFRTIVGYAKVAYDDPIVKPAQPGQTHLHTFFGATCVNAWSTNDDGPRSIRNCPRTNASGGTLNMSSYWVPSTIYHCPTTFVDPNCHYEQDGRVVLPSQFLVYYKGHFGSGAFTNNGTNDNPWHSQMANDIVPFPKGFRMLTGNPSATTQGTASSHFKWTCYKPDGQSVASEGAHIPGSGTGAAAECTTTNVGASWQGGYIRQTMSFPHCWNGTDVDSPDHVSHTVHNVSDACPSGWDKQTTGVEFIIDYDYASVGHDPVNLRGLADIKYWRLSSDNYADTLAAGFSTHGDWFNGWDETVMERWIEDCLHPGTDCFVNVAGAHPNNTTTPVITTWRLFGNPRRNR